MQLPIDRTMDNSPSDPYELPADSFDMPSASGLVQASYQPVPAPAGRRGPWVLVASAVAVLALVGGGGFLALQAFTAVSQAPAAVMPPDTDVYFAVDLLQLTGEDTTGALVDTVRGVLGRLGEDVQDPEALIADLDAQLQASAGFDFSNDIRPWIGRTIGIGVLGGRWDPLDSTSTPDMLIAVEVRNDGEAQDFLNTFSESVGRQGIVLAPATYGGVDLLVWTDAGTEAAIGVSNGMLLAGTTVAVQRGIDAQRGTSLADDPNFTEATESLPESRLFTGWVDAGFYRTAYENLMASDFGAASPDVELAQDLLDGWTGASFAVTVTESGVAFDAVVLFEEGNAPGWYTQELLGTGAVPALLPVDTLAFAEYGSPAGIWSSVAASIMGFQSDYEEQLDEFAGEIGFHPIDDFVAYLDGSLGVALLRSEAGLLAAEAGYPIGLVGFVGTSSPDPLRATIRQLNTLLGDEGMPFATTNVAGNDFYVFEDDGQEAVAWGVTDQRFMIGTSSSDLARIGAGGPNLTANPAYAAAVEALPGDNYAVSFFADVDGMVDVFGAEGDVRVALEPFNAIIAGTSIDGSRYRGSLIVLIDYDR
jgi:hypothetical protein